MFLSGDDKDARAVVSALTDDIGYAPVWDSNPAWAATDSACTGICQHRLPVLHIGADRVQFEAVAGRIDCGVEESAEGGQVPLVTDSRCAAPYDDSRWRTSCENGLAERS